MFINHRTNVLTMGPQYDQATNKIVTFNSMGSATFTNTWLNYTKGTDYRDFSFNITDEPILDTHTNDVRIYVLDESDVETVELVAGELPPGVDFSHGYVNGRYTGPALGTTTHVMYNSSWRTVSYDSTITTFDVTIVVKNRDEENYPIPEDDPAYEITLLDGCQGTQPPPACFLKNCQPGRPGMICDGFKLGCNCVQ
jgi:hypothetical protein